MNLSKAFLRFGANWTFAISALMQIASRTRKAQLLWLDIVWMWNWLDTAPKILFTLRIAHSRVWSVRIYSCRNYSDLILADATIRWSNFYSITGKETNWFIITNALILRQHIIWLQYVLVIDADLLGSLLLPIVWSRIWTILIVHCNDYSLLIQTDATDYWTQDGHWQTREISEPVEASWLLDAEATFHVAREICTNVLLLHHHQRQLILTLFQSRPKQKEYFRIRRSSSASVSFTFGSDSFAQHRPSLSLSFLAPKQNRLASRAPP